MSKMSFLEKIDILFKMSKSSYLYVLIILILILLGIIFSTTNKRTVKRNKKIYIGVSIFILVCMILIYHTSLAKIFDYMMNNLFIIIYFPNIAIYLAALIAMNIIVWISIFSFQTSESIKKLNSIIYVIMNYLLFLVLSVINKNDLDVFTQSSIYGNKKATALIELSSIIFVVWIIFLILYRIILVYIRKDYKPKVKKVVVKKKVKILPENYEPIETPNRLYGSIPKRNTDSNQLLINQQETILKLEKEIEKEKELAKTYDNLLTKEDYQRILKILLQQKEHNLYDKEDEFIEEPRIVDRQEIDYREKQKQEIIRLEEERKESLRKEKLKLERAKQEFEERKLEENMTELERLYKGIR